MKLQLAVFLIFFSPVIVALTIHREEGNTGLVFSRDYSGNVFGNNGVVQKRDSVSENPREEVKGKLMKVVGELKEFVTENDIGYSKFEQETEMISQTISLTEELMKTNLKPGNFLEELQVTKRLYEALKTSLATRKRFEGCEYPGADLVEDAMDVNVQAMSLYHLESFDEDQVPGYDGRFSAIKPRLQSLEARDKSHLSPGMRKILTEQTKLAQESLDLVEDLNFFGGPPVENSNTESSVDPGFNWHGQFEKAAKNIEVDSSATEGIDSGFNWHGKFLEAAKNANDLHDAVSA